MYQRYLKRLLDLFFAVALILLSAPLLILMAILIRIKLGSPILFRQERPGFQEKLFTLYKFRTMTELQDREGKLLPDCDRMTKLGKLLRASSLDELPELFNVLKGEMSFIGPRPLLVEYLPLYNELQRRRHEIRPGLSGLAQVKGRNSISWEDKFILDIKYVDHISFVMDCKIAILTLGKVLIRSGIHSDTSSTMEYFRGKDYGNGEEEIKNEEIKNEEIEEKEIKEKEIKKKEIKEEEIKEKEIREKVSSKNQLLIMGAGGHGRSVADIALQMMLWQRIAFLDDSDMEQSMGIEVIGKLSEIDQYISNWEVFVAIGDNTVRKGILLKLIELQADIPTLLHPSAILGSQIVIGAGTVVMAGAVINCCSTIGSGCIINTGVTIDHDNVLGDYVHISPGSHLAGKVKVGDNCWLGTGCIVIPNITMIENCIIGAGSVVLNNIMEQGRYVGVPVRKL